jgi:hypothetical protein
MPETDEERRARERANSERAEELKRVPLKTVDKSKWPRGVRPIAMAETDGLGVDREGRLHWDGKPVEIIGRRLDLTTTQAIVAIVVAVFTGIIAIGTAIQGWTAYHDWACKTEWHVFAACPKKPVAPPNDTPS